MGNSAPRRPTSDQVPRPWEDVRPRGRLGTAPTLITFLLSFCKLSEMALPPILPWNGGYPPWRGSRYQGAELGKVIELHIDFFSPYGYLGSVCLNACTDMRMSRCLEIPAPERPTASIVSHRLLTGQSITIPTTSATWLGITKVRMRALFRPRHRGDSRALRMLCCLVPDALGQVLLRPHVRHEDAWCAQQCHV